MGKKATRPDTDLNAAPSYRMAAARKFLGLTDAEVKAAVYCKKGTRLTAYIMGGGIEFRFTYNDLMAYKNKEMALAGEQKTSPLPKEIKSDLDIKQPDSKPDINTWKKRKRYE